MPTYVDRLVNCGYPIEQAIQLCRKFWEENSLEETEEFVRLQELFYDDRREYVE